MIIHWPFLLAAVALLLPPLPLSPALREYVLSVRRNSSANVQAMLQPWQNWVDLIRAGTGAYLLTEFAIRVAPQVKGAGAKELALEGGILGMALLLQIIRFGRGVQFIGPIFYLCGITLVLANYDVGGFAVFAGWLFGLGSRRPVLLLPAMAVALAAAGYLLGLNLRVILNCALFFPPLLLTFLFRQPLLFVAKDPAPLPRN